MSRKTNKKDCSFAKFLTGFNINNDFDDSGTNQLFALFITEAEEESLTKKTKKKTSTTYVKKKSKQPDKIFNYIHTAYCQTLFFSDSYNDTTYSSNRKNSNKSLPDPCYNGSSCTFLNPEYLNRVLSIDITIV